MFCVILQLHGQIYDFSNVIIETYSTEHIKVQRGLSQNSIWSMLEDSKGFLWIGTWDGLNRFDGYDFLVIKPNPNDEENSLSNETINALFEDSEKQIWIGTDKGLNVLQPATLQIQSFLHDKTNPHSLCDDHIFSITEDIHGNIYIGTELCLCKYNKQSKHFEKVALFAESNMGQDDMTIYELYSSNDKKTIWVGTSRGLFSIFTDKNTIQRYSKETYKQIPSDTITSVFQDSRGSVWIGTYSGLVRMKRSDNKIYIEPLKFDHNVLSFMEDKNGHVWIGTNGHGVGVYSYEHNEIYHPFHQTISNNTLSNNIIYSLLQTKNGSIWVGTWRGLNKFTPGVFRFNHIASQIGERNLKSPLIWSFLEIEPDKIWVGTEDGIQIFDKKAAHFIASINTKTNSNISLPSDKIRHMYKDSHSRIWIGTVDNGLVVYNPENKRSIHYHKRASNPQNKIIGNAAWSITEDTFDGSIWIATDEGINRLLSNGDIKTYTYDPKNPKTLSGNLVYHILQDTKGNIWASTFSGINLFRRSDETWIHYRSNSTDIYSVNTDRILSMTEGSDGVMWVATMGGGINRFVPKEGKFTAITENEGLANNIVYNIIEDEQGNLWLTTNQGISKYYPQSGIISNFDIRDGVQGYEFNSGAAIRTSTGDIFVGGMNGFNYFNPKQLTQNQFEPQLYITSFSILNNITSLFLEDKSTITLSYNENHFSFSFSALDYTNSGKINYAYKLNGFDNEWVYVSSAKRYAEYTNVPPGRYTFKVKATNSDGIWINKPISISLYIQAPFWRTFLFRIIIALLSTAMIWYIVYSQIRKIRKKQLIQMKMFEFEKNVFDLEQRVLRLQMNPHFLFNTLNSIQGLILQDEKKKAVEYVSKYSTMMRLLLTTGKSSFILLNDELQLLKNYLDIEMLRFENMFEYEIIVDEDIEEDFVAIPSYMIQPFVENSIKHGFRSKTEKGNITISFSSDEQSIIIKIEDNGIGREKAMQLSAGNIVKKESQSIQITTERLHIFNKQQKINIYTIEFEDLKDNIGNAKGTVVKLKVPFKNM